MLTSTLTSVERIDYTNHIGTELPTVQLHDLDEAGVAEIKQLVAE